MFFCNPDIDKVADLSFITDSSTLDVMDLFDPVAGRCKISSIWLHSLRPGHRIVMMESKYSGDDKFD